MIDTRKMQKYDKIILISLDTLRNDALGLCPIKKYKKVYTSVRNISTKVLDNLISKWVYFQNCYTAAPYTSASHWAIFSWKRPIENWLFEFYNKPIQKKIIFEYFKEKGYETIGNIDFPFVIWEYLKLNKGIDNYFIEDEFQALEKMKESKKSLSFFHFGWIHYPYGFHKFKFWWKDYLDKIEKLEKEYNVQWEELTDTIVETHYDKQEMELLMRYKTIISTLYKQKKYETLFDLYLEWIEYFLKNRFEPFLNELFKQIKWQKYLIVLFSDHGEEWSNGDYWHYNSISDGVLNVPLAFISSELTSKSISSRVRTIDILPTILELCGFDIDYDINGESLAMSILSDEIYNDKCVYAQSRTAIEYNKLKTIRKMMIDKKVENTDIKHVLEKECIIDWSYKLERIYKENGDLNAKKLYTYDNWIPVLYENKGIERKLERLLEEYNKKKIVRDDTASDPEEWMKYLFKNLGYEI